MLAGNVFLTTLNICKYNKLNQQDGKVYLEYISLEYKSLDDPQVHLCSALHNIDHCHHNIPVW